MITRMEVFSSRQGAPVLPLGGETANDDPVQIHNIDGLEPVKADIATTPFANADGEIYQGSSVGKRNIVLTVGLNPDWETQTISDLRMLLYAYFSPKAWVKLRFHTDHLPASSEVDIEGYVESMAPNIFSQDPEIQISIICPRPHFIDASATFVDGVVDDTDSPTAVQIDYEGTVVTGFEVRVENTAAVAAYTGKLTIANEAPVLQPFIIDPVTIDATHKFRLSTIKNSKRAQAVNPDGTAVNLLAYVTKDSTWPQISPGINRFLVTADAPGQKWTLAYFNRYGGL